MRARLLPRPGKRVGPVPDGRAPQPLGRLHLLAFAAFLAALVLLGRNPRPQEQDPCFRWGVKAFRRQDYPRALADFTAVLQAHPDHADAYFNRGLTYSYLDQPDRALADFSAALDLNPQRADAYLTRGALYLARRNYEAALADFNQAIRLKPRTAGVYVNRGSIYAARGDPKRALADYSEAIRLDPASAADVYASRAAAYLQLRDYERAAADYQEAIRRDPNDPSSYNDLAWLRATCPVARVRDGQQALACARQANQLTSWQQPRLLGTLAAAYAAAGNFDEALAWQQKALQRAGGLAAEELRKQQRALRCYAEHKPFRDE